MVCRGYVYAKYQVGRGVSQSKTELGWLSCYAEPGERGVDDPGILCQTWRGRRINVLLYLPRELSLLEGR